MATFSKRQAASIFDRVPPEIATRIFDLATANRRPNAASCRLVSQYFHLHSSPYLVPTIVITSRLDALTKARDILQHPYFSQHVTHLLWDASYYDEGLATEWGNYQRAFDEAKHNFHYRDLVVCHSRGADDTMEDQLRGVEPTSTSHAQNDPEDLLGDQLMRGLHLSFSEYYRRWRRQEKTYSKPLGEEKTDTGNSSGKGDLARHYFLKAIKELPQLRHISYSDYRALAYDGESYAELCRRLFGNVVCASLDYLRSYNRTRLKMFLEDLAEHRPIWRSLSIGRQPFERSPVDEERGRLVGSLVDPTGNGFTVLECQSLFPTTQGIDSPKIQAQALRLPLLDNDTTNFYEHETLSPKGIGRLIRNLGAGLVDLEIGSHIFLDELRRSRRSRHLDYLDDRLNTIKALDLSNLNALKSLSLRGLAFDISSSRKVLTKYAKTLRTLRLVDCYCLETYDAFEIFARDELASTLSLTGVEIHSLLFKNSTSLGLDLRFEPSFQVYRAIIDEQLSSTYGIHGLSSHVRTMDHQALKARSVQSRVDLVGGWPYERYELENAMFGGRVNAVVRHVRSVSKTQGNLWWEEPVSYT